METYPGAPDFNDIKKALEAMLLATRRPLLPKEAAKILQISPEQVIDLLAILKSEYEDRGLTIVQTAGGARIGTKATYARYVQAVVNPSLEVEISPAALETLSIIAYKQPATRQEVEKIRGVDSSGVIKYLLELELIKEVGRSETVGRPILYSTTELFLEKFGLKSLGDLPPWQETPEEALRETVSILPPELGRMEIIAPPISRPPIGDPLLN